MEGEGRGGEGEEDSKNRNHSVGTNFSSAHSKESSTIVSRVSYLLVKCIHCLRTCTKMHPLSAHMY